MSHFSPTRRIAFALIAALGAFSAESALAAATYSFDCSKTDCSNANTSAFGNTRTFSAVESVTGQTITVTASAYSNTTGTNTANNAAAQTLNNAYLAAYGTTGQAAGSSGFGIRNRDAASSDVDSNEGVSPEHAIDNNQRYDMVLFTFSTAVTLSQVKLGWATTDSDLSILAYGGTGTAPLTGLTYAGLITNGWQAIGSYADVGTASAKTVNTNNLSSTTWLIGAYNPLSGDTTCSACTSGNDYFKLLSLSIKDQTKPTTEVPEPGSLALVGLALAGIAASRRLKK